MNRAAAGDLCSLDVCPLLSGWMGAFSRDGDTAEDQQPEEGWFREECCHQKPSRGAWENGLWCSPSHYHKSTSSIRPDSADTHLNTNMTQSNTHSLHNHPICPAQQQQRRKWGCNAILPGSWWAICRMTYMLHSFICFHKHAAASALTVS